MQPTDDGLVRTRTSLLRRLGDWNDSASWQDFFNSYSRLILSVAVKCGLSPTEAEDVLQETMFSVAKKIPGFVYDRSKGSFRSWLMRLTRWRIVDHVRKNKRGVALSTSDDFLPEDLIIAGNEDLETIWNSEWKAALREAALNKVKLVLDPQEYQLFHFNVHKSWPVTRIAETFNVSANQVYLAKSRVVRLLRVEVKRLARGSI